MQDFHPNPNVDESVVTGQEQALGLKYIRSHVNRLPEVTLARIGRGLGFFHPLEQIRYDALIETRPYRWAELGLGMYYALLALSIGGTIILRRRKVLVFPLWAIGLDVLAVFIISFGQTRYRVTFEVSLVILASVQIEWLWAKLTPGRRRHRAAPVDSQADPDELGEIPQAPVAVEA